MASTYLTRTPSSGGNRKTFTISTWFKRSNLSSVQQLVQAATDGSTRTNVILRSEDSIQLYSENGGIQKINVRTNRVFRDTNAWFHLVLAVDTTQATASDRVKIYINGTQETSLHTAVYGDQNYDTQFNHTVAQTIGRRDAYSDQYFDGLISHFHLVDGSALAPTVFGSTDSTTGEWKINTSPSYTVGTNGFFVLKDTNSGTDQSANTNNLTVNGTLTKTEDNPSNVFCTLNPLSQDISGYASGNAGVIDTQNGNTFGNKVTHGAYLGTIGVSSGKYYWEVKVGDTNQLIGIVAMRPTGGVTYLYDDATANGYYPYGNDVYTNGSSASGGPYDNTSNKIYSFALDAGNNKLWVGRDGSFTGDPANGTGATWASLPTGHDWTPLMHSMATSQNNYAYFNFGNGYFGTTAVSSAGTNASGNGIFEYDVPTGYTALSTKGLNL